MGEWCKTIQGNIWKNECILEYKESLIAVNPVDIDSLKETIKRDTDTLEFLVKKYAIKNI